MKVHHVYGILDAPVQAWLRCVPVNEFLIPLVCALQAEALRANYSSAYIRIDIEDNTN